MPHELVPAARCATADRRQMPHELVPAATTIARLLNPTGHDNASDPSETRTAWAHWQRLCSEKLLASDA
jgi:hypothetical protein